VALGLPDFPRYRSLFEETRTGLAKLGVVLLMSIRTETLRLGDSERSGTSSFPLHTCERSFTRL
jgi:hypothetical protein